MTKILAGGTETVNRTVDQVPAASGVLFRQTCPVDGISIVLQVVSRGLRTARLSPTAVWYLGSMDSRFNV
jgi:hypothetical protein